MTTVAPPGSVPVSQTPNDSSAASQLSWEGDKMFNIYIYDYCYKRGFRKTARELLLEAEIPSDSTPPINARQGLLFEWWSVFWVLFTAKANGNGTEDAMLYTQHQAHQAAMKQNQSRAQAQQPLPMGPGQIPLGARGPVNGLGPQRGFGAPNGVMPNGIPTPGNGQPPGPTAFSGGPNGIMSGPPPPGMGQQHFIPGRPPMGGPPRPPNGGPPFHSPTMAHSPPNLGQPPQPPQHHQPPPMGGLGPPQRGMPPPGQQGMHPGQQTPTQMYQNVGGRPPSRTSTPQSGGMMPSPSIGNRQPMNDPRQEMNVNNELQGIPAQLLTVIKSEMGIGGKDIQLLTMQEKTTIIMRSRARKTGANNAAAGPSSMQPPPQRRNNKRNSSTSPGEDQQDDRRNGSSPPEKRPRRSPADPQIPTAPMNYPHLNQPPQSQPGVPGGPGGPGGPPQPMGNGGMMRQMGGGPMNGGFQPQGQPNMAGQMSNPMGMLGGGGMNPMNPMMSNSMSPQMQAQQAMGGMGAMQYRQPMHMQPHPNNRMGGAMNAGSPGADPSFNPGSGGPGLPGGPQQGPQQQQFTQAGRLAGPPNAKPMGMLPPPSPAKDQNGMGKDNKPLNGHPEGSPRNQPLSGTNPPGTNPPTPGSSQGQGGNMAPSPNMLINPNPGSMNPVAMPLPPPPPPTDNLFSADFIQNVANGLDDFDVGLFRGDGDINFERDFGQWFNPDDVPTMDLGKQ
ncbi:hypothetical protein DFH07DRAFT_832418 [Mycena maculata]|uniref:LisH domain-containing protein n=1 Tax=Mycena maculata TaxID=230809 RepID=A0AAD7IMV2_9AGAR|nr:hypothetical protein DFH07DRAFT_832418 [Mycena maculata]